jgi:hypothetical protein
VHAIQLSAPPASALPPDAIDAPAIETPAPTPSAAALAPSTPAAATRAPSAQAPAQEAVLAMAQGPARQPYPSLQSGANGHPAPQARPNGRPAPDTGSGPEHHDEEAVERGATGPQLRRFIKSRAYVPMHELRRRFLINGGDDDVTPVDLGERRRVFVGLPEREGRLLGELLRGGDIGYELSLDPISPIVVGVYPMRPVTRA